MDLDTAATKIADLVRYELGGDLLTLVHSAMDDVEDARQAIARGEDAADMGEWIESIAGRLADIKGIKEIDKYSITFDTNHFDVFVQQIRVIQ